MLVIRFLPRKKPSPFRWRAKTHQRKDEGINSRSCYNFRVTTLLAGKTCRSFAADTARPSNGGKPAPTTRGSGKSAFAEAARRGYRHPLLAAVSHNRRLSGNGAAGKSCPVHSSCQMMMALRYALFRHLSIPFCAKEKTSAWLTNFTKQNVNFWSKQQCSVSLHAKTPQVSLRRLLFQTQS